MSEYKPPVKEKMFVKLDKDDFVVTVFKASDPSARIPDLDKYKEVTDEADKLKMKAGEFKFDKADGKFKPLTQEDKDKKPKDYGEIPK